MLVNEKMVNMYICHSITDCLW